MQFVKPADSVGEAVLVEQHETERKTRRRLWICRTTSLLGVRLRFD